MTHSLKIDPILPPVLLYVLLWVFVMGEIYLLVRSAANARELGFSRRKKIFTSLRWFSLIIATVSIVIAAFRPVNINLFEEKKNLSRDQYNRNIFIVIDSSPSTRTLDEANQKTRVELMRDDALNIVRENMYAHISVITYGHSARLDWPLSTDNWSLTQFLRSFDAYDTTTVSDMHSADPWDPAKYVKAQIVNSHISNPEMTNWLFFLSDGDPLAKEKTDAHQSIKYSDIPFIDGGSVVAYGTDRGGKVVAFTVNNNPTYVDQNGSPLIVHRDVTKLKKIAQDTGIDFRDREHNFPSDLGEAFAHPAKNRSKSSDKSDTTELYWIAALVGTILLILEFAVTIRSAGIIPRLFTRRK